jgi:hypothetical protein
MAYVNANLLSVRSDQLISIQNFTQNFNWVDKMLGCKCQQNVNKFIVFRVHIILDHHGSKTIDWPGNIHLN